jgi:Glycosyltransferase family 87
MRPRGWVWPAVVAGALFLVACLFAYGGLLSHSRPGDTSVYSQYGRALVHHGRFPYRDFYDEYPPGSVPVFILPAILWDQHYVLVFKTWMALCGLGFVACSAWVLHRLGLSQLRLLPIVLAPALMGPVFLNRYDPLSALLTALALVALMRGRERTTGALLGVATAMKIYPAVVALIAVRRVRDRVGSIAGFLVAGAVLFVPFFVLAPGGVGYSLWSQAKRHLQVETLGSSVLLALDKIGVYDTHWINGKPGSIDLDGGLPNALGVVSSLVSVALVLLVFRAYCRGADTDRRLATAWAAALIAFTVFGKVLSPQYLTWIVPFVPLAAGRRGLYASGTLLAALALTQPYSYGGTPWLLDWTVWALLARNLLLVATFLFLYSALRREPS